MSLPILYIRGWAPGLWGVGRSTREHLSKHTSGGQEQRLGLLVEAAMQLAGKGASLGCSEVAASSTPG